MGQHIFCHKLLNLLPRGGWAPTRTEPLPGRRRGGGGGEAMGASRYGCRCCRGARGRLRRAGSHFKITLAAGEEWIGRGRRGARGPAGNPRYCRGQMTVAWTEALMQRWRDLDRPAVQGWRWHPCAGPWTGRGPGRGPGPKAFHEVPWPGTWTFRSTLSASYHPAVTKTLARPRQPLPAASAIPLKDQSHPGHVTTQPESLHSLGERMKANSGPLPPRLVVSV